LDRKTAIVTGSGSEKGIGRATALALAKQGAVVIAADIDAHGADETAKNIRDLGGKAIGIVLDVTNQNSVDNMIRTTMEEFGRIDILVNNAGISQRVTVNNMQADDVRRIFEINVIGLFRCTKGVLEIMKRQKYGRIVNMSSAAGKRGGGFFGGAHYSASKAAVLGFSKNLAREVAQDGITVNSIAPGLIITDIWDTMPKEIAEDIISAIPIGRPGKVNEVAAAIAFLVSDEASYITGEEIDINGGSHMD